MRKRLIVCSDGTWGTAEGAVGGIFRPTNVVKIEQAILASAPDGTPQAGFYDAGVGTGNLVDMVSGGILGLGLSQNVEDAYRFLAQNYSEDDEIYLFGFSRGAYTVRSVAGFIRKCGLLKKAELGHLAEAFALYRRRDDTADTPDAKDFRERYSRPPLRIKFIGVWDTVGALGIPVDLPLRFLTIGCYQFHDVALSRSVDFAYHAVAIDERRAPFEPTLWEQHSEPGKQVMEQKWFVGDHMDVGGGHRSEALSDVALLWLIERAQATGLAFDGDALSALRPDPLGTLHDSREFPFNLLPEHIRPIGVKERGNEKLHPSVRERYGADPSYRPENLVKFLQRADSSASTL
jgi:uncharacterized protein (DUF2235 family)